MSRSATARFSHCIAPCSRYHRPMSLDDDAPIEGRNPYPIRFLRHDWRLARNQLEAKTSGPGRAKGFAGNEASPGPTVSSQARGLWPSSALVATAVVG